MLSTNGVTPIAIMVPTCIARKPPMAVAVALSLLGNQAMAKGLAPQRKVKLLKATINWPKRSSQKKWCPA